jgi:hypothetical protein
MVGQPNADAFQLFVGELVLWELGHRSRPFQQVALGAHQRSPYQSLMIITTTVAMMAAATIWFGLGK